MKFQTSQFKRRYSVPRSIFYFLFIIFYFLFLNNALAATNISSNSYEHWAWNDAVGWIDFYSTENINVYPDRIEGYASSSMGFVALNCNSTPGGDICSGPAGNWKVINDGGGTLSGWAWNDSIGWISFNCSNTNSCVSSSYQVNINNTSGDFSGWAWNDIIGWISFNCSDPNVCSSSNYKSKTFWRATSTVGVLISSIFDTQITGGSAINSLLWQGDQPSGTSVKFKIASSNSSSSSWSYLGPNGSTADDDVYLSTGAGIPISIKLQYHNNQRYFRYKIILESNAAQTASPRVDNVIINWSP